MFTTETRRRRSVGSSKRPLAAFLQEFGVVAILAVAVVSVDVAEDIAVVDAVVVVVGVVSVAVVSVVVVIEAAVDSDANVTFIGV